MLLLYAIRAKICKNERNAFKNFINATKTNLEKTVCMRVAIIGSRKLNVDIDKYIPKDINLLISGGAKGVDALAEMYAEKNGIEKLIILPDYKRFGKSAPLKQNEQIVSNADIVIALWDGISRGTKFTIDYALKQNKKVIVYLIKEY